MRYLIQDRQGSVVAVAGVGSATSINTYDEYGVPGSSNTGRFQYNGQPWIPEAGLYHARARAYSPSFGRFMQTDPIGYGDGLNLYAYVHDDPVNGWDPTGTVREFCDIDRNVYTYPDGHVEYGQPYQANCHFFDDSTPQNVVSAVIVQARRHLAPNVQVMRYNRRVDANYCYGRAIVSNTGSLGLDAAGVALAVFAPEVGAFTAIAGSSLGLVGIANAAIHRNLPSGVLAYGGKEVAVVSGFVRGGSAAARIVARANLLTLGGSIGYDLYSVQKEAVACMRGQD